MKKLFVLLTLALVFVCLNSCDMSDDAVAKVGSVEISKAEYIDVLQKRFPGKTSFTDVDSMTKITAINSLVVSKRKLADAYALNLENNEEVQEILAKQREALLVNKYYEHEIVDVLLPEEKLRAVFDKKKEEVKASHILLSFKGPHNPQASRTKDEAKQLADEIYTKVKGGSDFSELAMEYSDDPSKERNKGDLGYFAGGQMAPAFEEAAFALSIDEISQPVETQFGFHVIRLEDRRDNPKMADKSFEDEKLNIKMSLYRSVQGQANELMGKHIDSLKKTFEFVILDENINTIVSAAGRVQAEQNKTEPGEFTADEKDLALVTWDGGEYKFGQLIKDGGDNIQRLQQLIKNQMQFKQTVEGQGMQLIMVDIALDRGYDRDKNLMENLDNIQEKIMLMQIEKVQISEKTEIADGEKKKYYEEHKEELVNKAKIEIWEIQVETEKLAKSIFRRAKDGRSFNMMAIKNSVDKVYGKKGGYLGFQEKGQRGLISREAFKAGADAIVGPVKYRTNWVVIKTGELKEQEYKTFEESEALIVSKLKRELNNERKKEWDKELLENYPLTINHEVLNSI